MWRIWQNAQKFHKISVDSGLSSWKFQEDLRLRRKIWNSLFQLPKTKEIRHEFEADFPEAEKSLKRLEARKIFLKDLKKIVFIFLASKRNFSWPKVWDLRF